MTEPGAGGENPAPGGNGNPADKYSAPKAVNDSLEKMFGGGNPIDDHDDSERRRKVREGNPGGKKNPGSVLERVAERMRDDIERMAGAGSVLAQMLTKLLESNLPPQYQSYFHALETALSSQIVNRYDEMRHRIPEEEMFSAVASEGRSVYTQEYRSAVGNFAFIIDVSGSMGGDEVGAAAAHMLDIADNLRPDNTMSVIQVSGEGSEGHLNPEGFWVPAGVVDWQDFEIGSAEYNEYMNNAREKGFEVRGSGGTQFGQLFEELSKYDPQFDAILVFSDMGIGDLEQLEDPGCPVMWLTWGASKETKVPFGEIYEVDSLFESIRQEADMQTGIGR